MLRTLVAGVVMILLGSVVALADEVIYRYEGEAVPHDPSEGWLIFDACDPPCSESAADGSYQLFWDTGGDTNNYQYWISLAPDPPPPRSGLNGDTARRPQDRPISTPATDGL